MPARYRLILGTKNWSSWSLRAYMAMRATGAKFEEILVTLRRPETRENIRALAPADRVPVLLIEENGTEFAVFDSLAICETLAERHPEAKLWPGTPVARARARSISAAMHSGFAALRETLSMEFARRLPTPELSPAAPADIAEIVAFWKEALAGSADGFLFGQMTIADCMYAPVVSRFKTYGITLEPVLQSYCDRMFALPAMRDWLDCARREVEAGLP